MSAKRESVVCDFLEKFSFPGRVMSEEFVLIPGRTAKQGTTLNEGKETADYIEEVSTLQVSPADMQRLGLSEGDRVRLSTQQGEVIVPCKAARGDELPEGVLFISYGPVSSRLMGGDTHGTGMPDSKGFEVMLEKCDSQKPAAAESE